MQMNSVTALLITLSREGGGCDVPVGFTLKIHFDQMGGRAEGKWHKSERQTSFFRVELKQQI